MPRSKFLENTGVFPYLNFTGAFAKSGGGDTKSIQFLAVKLNAVSALFQEASVCFLLNFELDFHGLGSRRGVDDIAGNSTIVRLLFPLLVFYFYIFKAFPHKVC